MIEFLVILRVVSDYFWEYKIISVVCTALMFFSSIIYFSHSARRAKIIAPDILIIVFMLLVTTSEIINPATNSMIDFSKFAAFVLVYIAGRIGPIQLKAPYLLGFASIVGLLGFSMAALMGFGFQYWGNVATFSGGYYFKTDMAISALILLAIVFSVIKSWLALLVASLLAFYVVFITNTRVALPLALAIPVFVYLVRGGYIKKVNVRAIANTVITIGAGMVLFLVIDLGAIGLLDFDFSDPFSEANTQGRTVIWSALLEAYGKADPLRKLIGSGLGADSAATFFFSESRFLEGARAHNSYLYLLLCTGIVGATIFLALLISIICRLPMLLQSSDEQSLIISSIFASLTLIFLWTSLTTEIVIRPQLMILYFYFSGIMVQRNLYLKELVRARRVKKYSSTGDAVLPKSHH